MAKGLYEYGYTENIDSRDLIQRLEELEADNAKVGVGLEGDELGELETLREICDEGEQYIVDWFYGEGLIPESEFTDYAKELAEDIGAMGREIIWPHTHIDWEEAADALKADYSEITINGRTYLGLTG